MNSFLRIALSIPLFLLITCTSNVSVKRDYQFCNNSSIAIAELYVTDREKAGKEVPKIGRTFANALVGFFLETGLNVVEREKIDSILKEMQLERSGLIDSSRMAELGRMLNADYLLTGMGEIHNHGKSTFLISTTVRLIHVETGEIVLVASWEGPSHKPVQVAEKLGETIRRKLRRKVVACREKR